MRNIAFLMLVAISAFSGIGQDLAAQSSSSSAAAAAGGGADTEDNG